MGYLICEKCKSYHGLQKGESYDDWGYCHCNGKLKYYDNLEDYFSEIKLQESEISDVPENRISLQNHKMSENQIEDLLLIDNLLKIDKEKDKIENEIKRRERLKRERKYHINHSITMNKEKALSSQRKKPYKSIVAVELLGDNLNPEKEKLMKELDLYQDIRKHSQCDPDKSEKFLIDTACVVFMSSIFLFLYGISYNYWILNSMGICAVLFASYLYLTSKNEKITIITFMQKIYLYSGGFLVFTGSLFILFMITNYNKLLEYYYGIDSLEISIVITLILLYCGIKIILSYNISDEPF